MNDHDTPEDRATTALIRALATRHEPPAALRDRVTAAIDAARATHAPGTPSPMDADDVTRAASHVRRPPPRAWATMVPGASRSGWRLRLPTVAIAASAFAFGAIFATALTGIFQRSALESRIEDDVVSAHVRAVMMARATDVVSSDQHTVKPWLSSRLDFSPSVVDLATDGYPLAGGRLDYVGGRTVATLVYQRNKHVIDVFVWPASAMPVAAASRQSRNGLTTVTWDQDGLRYWAISDIAPAELAAFGELLRRRTTTG